MPNKRIDQLTAASSIADTDLMVLADPGTGTMKKATRTQFLNNNAVSLIDGATVTWNYAQGSTASVTLGGNRNLVITNMPPNSYGILKIQQDNVGSRTLGLPNGSRRESGYLLTTTANALDIAGVFYDGTNYFWTLSKNYDGATATTSTTTTTTTTVAPTVTYLTWDFTGTRLEAFNSAKGIRVQNPDPGSGNRWAWANETLSAGQEAVFICPNPSSFSFCFGLDTTKEPNGDISAGGTWKYSVQTNGNYFARENGTSTNTGTVAVINDYIKLKYAGSTITLERATNVAGPWTVIATYAQTATGALNIGMDLYSGLTAVTEVYRQ